LKTFDSGFSLYIQWFEGISVFTKRVKSTFRSLHVSKKASFVLYFQRPSKKGRTNDVKEYSTKPAAGAQKIETLGGDWAHLRFSPTRIEFWKQQEQLSKTTLSYGHTLNVLTLGIVIV
jgi:hypothetical protein